ncbi:STAS domain-containing protein [Senegalimassilia faecalis]|uniref:STAS domain-containing protein n=1 Tax=Senegalimassilia faecalis TaxID=2509433 RepID=A0A4Q2JZQ8_9ACTN|nr:SulP family inorganic anion transporter [Senegalimassilia faecalis]RXZ54589.1 STAS domain-containing protein [Senegalimassilia faecalis]
MQHDKLKPILFSVIKHTDKEELRRQIPRDIVSGIVVAIVALPLSIALAIASGVGPEQGLYTAIVAGFLIALLGGSRVQISGPTAAFATIVAGIVATDGIDGLIAATIIAGILLVLMGLLKLGTLIRFVPYTITTGFTAGIAVTIVIGQVKDLLGLTYPAGTTTIETADKLAAIGANIATINGQALLVGAVCLAILIVWPRVSRRIPGSLVAVIVGAAMVGAFNLNVNTIGDLYTINTGLPTLHVPQLDLVLFRDELANGITIAILAAIESLLSCVVADSMISSHHRCNMELVAQGVGNIGSVLFGGIPATGAIARTAANVKSGGRTPIAGMVHAVVLLVVLVFLMPYAALIPMPTIAAILLQVAYNMSGWRNFAHLCRTASRGAVATLVLTFALTIVFDLVTAIAVGMLITMALFMKMVSEETEVKGWKYYCDENSEVTHLRELPKSVRVYEINGPMFFGMTDRISDISVKDFTKYLIIRMRGVPSLDATGMNALENLYDYCSENGVRLIFSHANEQPMKTMRRAGFVDLIGEEHFRPNIDDAIAHARALLEAEREQKQAAKSAA